MSTRLNLALQEILAARDYTNELLGALPESQWFRRPPEITTHVAWQVGHLAFAEYALALRRIRGTLPADEELVSGPFMELFVRGSQPQAHPEMYPPLHEIRATFDRVHRQTVATVEALTDAELDEPTLQPHRLFNTKLGALLWCSRHEMIHAGQIALLRRMIGHPPVW